MIPFLGVYFATYLMVVTVVRRDETAAVRGAILVFLIMISLFAPMKINLFGLHSNISAIAAASFVSLMTMLAIEYGFEFAMKIVLAVTQWLIFMQFVIFCMTKIPKQFFVGNSNDFTMLADVINDNTIHSFFATYTSSILATAGIAGIVAWCPCSRFAKFMLAVVSAYVFGGLAFYALAFRNDPDIVEVVLVSIPLKILMSLLYYPVVTRIRRQNV